MTTHVIHDTRMWKSLGLIGGGVEGRYLLEHWDAELDPDREAELRDHCRRCAPEITSLPAWAGLPFLDPFAYPKPQLLALVPVDPLGGLDDSRH